jgi:hypothetical protein
MKTYIKEWHNYERTILAERKCDLCGKIAMREKDWGGSCYDVNETEITVTVNQKKGSEYPEGGSGTAYEVDLCPDCFKDKLIPWLNSQGANLKEKDWDW